VDQDPTVNGVKDPVPENEIIGGSANPMFATAEVAAVSGIDWSEPEPKK